MPLIVWTRQGMRIREERVVEILEKYVMSRNECKKAEVDFSLSHFDFIF